MCILPFRYARDGRVYNDCMPLDGSEVCPVLGARLQECAPQVQLPVRLSRCLQGPGQQAAPRAINSSSSSTPGGSLLEKCVMVKVRSAMGRLWACGVALSVLL